MQRPSTGARSKGGGGCRRDLGCALPAVFVKIAPFFSPCSVPLSWPRSRWLPCCILSRACSAGRSAAVVGSALVRASSFGMGCCSISCFPFLWGTRRRGRAMDLSFCRPARGNTKKRGTPALRHREARLPNIFSTKKREQEETVREAVPDKKANPIEKLPLGIRHTVKAHGAQAGRKKKGRRNCSVIVAAFL